MIGGDQSGLVEALSGVVVDHEGNWEKSHLAQIGGKFAGIVMVTIPDGQRTHSSEICSHSRIRDCSR